VCQLSLNEYNDDDDDDDDNDDDPILLDDDTWIARRTIKNAHKITVMTGARVHFHFTLAGAVVQCSSKLFLTVISNPLFDFFADSKFRWWTGNGTIAATIFMRSSA